MKQQQKYLIDKPIRKNKIPVQLFPKSFNPMIHSSAKWEMDTTNMDWDDVVERVGRQIEKAKGVMRVELAVWQRK